MEVDAFARALLAGQPAFPRYFARMRPTNQAGPALLGGVVPPAEAARDRCRAGTPSTVGALVVDLRTAPEHAAGHVPGSLSIPPGHRSGRGSAGSCPIRIARWCSSFEARPTGTTRSARRCASASSRSSATSGAATWPGPRPGTQPKPARSSSSATWPPRSPEAARMRPVLIDVRQPAEFAAGHVPGALPIGAGDLPDRLDQLPRDRPIATICASGYRSSVAASLLRAAGFERVAWVSGGVPTWHAMGLPLEYGPERASGGWLAPDPPPGPCRLRADGRRGARPLASRSPAPHRASIGRALTAWRLVARSPLTGMSAAIPAWLVYGPRNRRRRSTVPCWLDRSTRITRDSSWVPAGLVIATPVGGYTNVAGNRAGAPRAGDVRPPRAPSTSAPSNLRTPDFLPTSDWYRWLGLANPPGCHHSSVQAVQDPERADRATGQAASRPMSSGRDDTSGRLDTVLGDRRAPGRIARSAGAVPDDRRRDEPGARAPTPRRSGSLRDDRLEVAAWAGLPDDVARATAVLPARRGLGRRGPAHRPGPGLAGRPRRSRATAIERYDGVFEFAGDLIAPLIHHDRVIGALAAVTREPRAWTSGDVAFISDAGHARRDRPHQRRAVRADRARAPPSSASLQAASARLSRASDRRPRSVGRSSRRRAGSSTTTTPASTWSSRPTRSSRSPSRARSAPTSRSTWRCSAAASARGSPAGSPSTASRSWSTTRTTTRAGATIPGTDDVDESMLVVPMRYDEATDRRDHALQARPRPVRRRTTCGCSRSWPTRPPPRSSRPGC